VKLESVCQQFVDAIKSNQSVFGIKLADETVQRLAEYYELVQTHNPILHLVAPCSPEDFATRHVLESLTLMKFLPQGARFADVGTGAGLPSVPCLIARDDLKAVLIESKEKKTTFLTEAAQRCGIADRVVIVNRQFNETAPDQSQYVVCRALDKFVEKLPHLLKWAGKRDLLLFGGPALMSALDGIGRQYVPELMPLSERRYLLAVPNS
jgi:16S rRNA (guanine(527)-N(7))-methyltransferase RsmG